MSARADVAFTAEAIEKLVTHLVERWGLRKVRLTGGEPTARRDLLDIVGRLARIEGLADLAMTTGGLTLRRDAEKLQRAGLKRVNVSLDSLKPPTFERLTGVPGAQRVLDGIAAAREAGLAPIRLNTVVLAGENDTDVPELALFAADQGLPIRFIELMPMGPLAAQWESRFVSADQIRERLEPIVRQWRLLPQGADSARSYAVTLNDGREVTIGFITPMSCNFCEACDRIRITATGDVFPCLMDHPRGNLLSAIHPRFDPELVDEILQTSLSQKAAEHPTAGFAVMTTIGG